MAVLVLFMSAAIGMVVYTIRREKREEIERAIAKSQSPPRRQARPSVQVEKPLQNEVPQPPDQADGDQGLRS
jgi:hypothetical protein